MNYQYGCTVNAEGKKEILKEILSSAALALVLVVGLAILPARASPHTYVWSCGNDGHIHLLVDGRMEFTMNQLCGPENPTIARGDAFNLVISGKKTQVSPTGKAFLDGLEKGGATVSLKRVPVQGATPKPSGRTETIHLNPADVSPGLAALLTKVAPDWKR